MEGPAVFKLAVDKLCKAILKVLEESGVTQDDIDWFVPHQANKRILDAVARRIGLDESKVVVTIDHHGNTSAASVPLALGEAIEDGRIKKGDLILMEAMGAGLTWGASLVRW
jgi:3-oxoacyl-[acyl-carrier-protein] synthase-3